MEAEGIYELQGQVIRYTFYSARGRSEGYAPQPYVISRSHTKQPLRSWQEHQPSSQFHSSQVRNSIKRTSSPRSGKCFDNGTSKPSSLGKVRFPPLPKNSQRYGIPQESEQSNFTPVEFDIIQIDQGEI